MATRRAKLQRGRKKGQNKVDTDAMMVFSILLERDHGAKPGVAARAAITAFFTWTGDPHPERQVDNRLMAVQKAVQRFKDGKRDVAGTIAGIALEQYRQTGERWTATPQEISAAVAEFLPKP